MYGVEYSLDNGPRTFLAEIDPYEREDGAIQKQMKVPGYGKRVNLQKKGARLPNKAWISYFEVHTQDGRVSLYASLRNTAGGCDTAGGPSTSAV